MTTAKRPSPALWKISVTARDPAAQIRNILDTYAELTRRDAASYPPLISVELRQTLPRTTLNLYIRNRQVAGFWPFIADYLQSDSDRTLFTYRVVDTCLFITLDQNLFAVTSGSAYRAFEDFVDYAFPFDTAKKLIANTFTASDVRELAGPRASRTEIYRKAQSISNSESFGKVWKRLVGRLNSDLVAKGSYLASIIDPDKPPAVEIKSSFTVRKSLDLAELVSLARELLTLPPAPLDQAAEMSFLDTLQVVRSKELTDRLRRQLIENLRQALVSNTPLDVDISDPGDIEAYQTGSDYRLSHWNLDGSPPALDDVLTVLRAGCRPVLADSDEFRRKIESLWLRYTKDLGEDSTEVRRKFHTFMHGQVQLNSRTYFLLDATWYLAHGDYLENLKKDFIGEVFGGRDPILIGPDLGLMEWSEGTEGAYNRKQGAQAGFYFGDEIFAVTDRGKVELFDLLRVDQVAGTLHVIHVKDGFDAKMRDACSQIAMSRDVIHRDLDNEKATLRRYFREAWLPNDQNVGRGVDEDTFLSWFDLPNIVYVVVASTRSSFTAADFDTRLTSHIARREIVVTHNDFKSLGERFRLAHVRRIKN